MKRTERDLAVIKRPAAQAAALAGRTGRPALNATGPNTAVPDEGRALIEAFLAWMAVQRGAATATQRAYGVDLAQLQDFLRSQGVDLGRPETVTKRHMQAFLAWLFHQGEAKSSMARKLAAARSFFRLQMRNGRVEENVAAQVRNPRQDKRQPRALNVDETFALLDAPTASPPATAEAERLLCRDLALAELLYGSGLRISEALQLDLDDVQLSSQVLRVMCAGAPCPPFRYLVRAPAGLALRATFAGRAGRGGPVCRRAGGSAAAARGRAHCGPALPAGRAGGDGFAAQSAPFLRHPSAGGGSGPAQRTGTFGAQAADHHPALYPGQPGAADGNL